MKSIWKFPFETTDDMRLMMPAEAKILSVQVQNGQPCIWALVSVNAPREERRFRIYGTGHTCRSSAENFVGTYQLMGGSLVFHLFEDE